MRTVAPKYLADELPHVAPLPMAADLNAAVSMRAIDRYRAARDLYAEMSAFCIREGLAPDAVAAITEISRLLGIP